GSAQVERERKVGVALLGPQLDFLWRMPHPDEAREAAAFGFISIHRKILVSEAARMRHVVLAAAERALHPGIDEVEGERRVHADGRVQRRRRLPGAVAHAA